MSSKIKVIKEKLTLMKTYVKESHNRSIKYNIDKNIVVSKKIIEGEKLNNKLVENTNLIVIAKPFVDELYNFVKGSEFFAILTDREGCILNIAGDKKILEKAKSYKMKLGAYMNEESIGTNAMGTAIVENRPVQISGKEHYIKAYHTWTCSGAPIHDEDGNIIGTLDLTGNSNEVHSHTLGMVVAAVKAIESAIILNKKNKQLKSSNAFIESLFDSIQDGIIFCDLNGHILSSNKQAANMFGYNKENLLKVKIDSIIYNWEKVKEDSLNSDDFHNEDIMINAKTNKLYFNLNTYTVSEHDEVYGIILMFKDIKKVRKLANKILGRKAIYTFDKIIGESNKFVEFVEFAKKIADSKSTILITGESGCGKEVFAQAIQNYSPRKKEAFVAINCSAIPRTLIESELFGYEEGAFTGAKRGGQIGKFEVADGGTIFLDEIGEMPLEMQTKLLRVIEEGTIIRVGGSTEIPVNVRIIAATNKNLKLEVNKGNFRHDLFYRLNVIPIELPALRERKEDIPLLAKYFMNKISYKINKKPIAINKLDMEILQNYNWPGNVRELENFIELSINKEKLALDLIHEEPKIELEKKEREKILTLEELEKNYIREILIHEDFNITNASKLLNIGRNTFYRKLEKYDIKCNKVCFEKNNCSKKEHCSEVEH